MLSPAGIPATVQGKAEMEVMRSIAEELGKICSGMKVSMQYQGGLQRGRHCQGSRECVNAAGE